jgi:uncharacterized HAD superfamily protein
MKRSPTPDGRMEAIAGGVRARLEDRTGFSRRLTDETVNAAQALGVADKDIEKWVNQRQRLLAKQEKRLRGIKSILDKVKAR